MLEHLCNMIGVAGYEKPVRDYILSQIKGHGDSIEVDALGNIIVFKKGYGQNKKRIMLCGHMDEVGLQVYAINGDGTCNVRNLGFSWPHGNYMQRVKFENGVKAIVAARCMGSEVKSHNDLRLDLGVKTKTEAEKLVKIGDVCTFDTTYDVINDEYITAKALDDRFACYLMMKMIIEDFKVYNDTYYVFTIQEETGCRGSKVAANYIQPDIGLALDVTPAQDRPGDISGENALGKGPAILISDTAIVAHEMVVDALIESAEANNIPYQRSCIYVGGNDGAAISLANNGVPSGLLGVVIRYCHTPFTMISKTDMDQTEQLTRAFLNYEFKTTYPIKIQ